MGGGQHEPTPDQGTPGQESEEGAPERRPQAPAPAGGTPAPDPGRPRSEQDPPDAASEEPREPGSPRSADGGDGGDGGDGESSHPVPPSGDSFELRQIEAMNRAGPSRPGERHPESDGWAEPGSTPWVRRRDAVLIGAGHALAEADSLTEVLDTVTRLRAPDFDLDELVVFGVTEKFLNAIEQDSLRRDGAERSVRIPMTTHYPAVDVLRTGRPVYLASPAEYQELYPTTWPLSAGQGRVSWAFLPLAAAGRITGVWLVSFRTPIAFTPEERGLLTTTARLVAQSLERTRTDEAELALSRGLRRSMGPEAPAHPGLGVATRYVPTGGGLVVGGDWYDSINLPNGRLALVIGDVQGHDVHAAGLMTQLRTAVHAYAAEGHGPDAVLSRASRFLADLDQDRFATCIYIEADPATGMMQIARAGHPHPVLRMPDGTCMIKHIRGGLPLGLMPDRDVDDYPVNTLELHPDEVMLLCTDGLIETGGHDMYTGWVRVRDAMSPGPPADLEGMADRLIRAVGNPVEGVEDARLSPRNEDDIALLLVRRASGGPRPAVPERRLVLTIEQDQAEGLAEARMQLKALLHDWARADQADTAVLLVSELLGNVLVHTEQPAALIATVTGPPARRTLLVEVTDRGDELPHQRAPGELASSGRGLVLLDILSDRWSVRPEAEGKTVWFELFEAEAPGAPDGAAGTDRTDGPDATGSTDSAPGGE
ncbi:SpoIIE family protein phosphatase [Streptomyces sp. NBC_01190]|uniref:ATP-binding SpoIIE family protein phosphatase n=1 Tax=Streptomyces sp. NBC_01190 TaxID=2903767 RepID=UPI00386D284A|nr:SpoIIE family protein phosphatase [Streptomyces sp. NBC_01190]